MKCPSCGKETSEGAKFCTSCGTPLGEASEGNASGTLEDGATVEVPQQAETPREGATVEVPQQAETPREEGEAFSIDQEAVTAAADAFTDSGPSYTADIAQAPLPDSAFEPQTQSSYAPPAPEAGARVAPTTYAGAPTNMGASQYGAPAYPPPMAPVQQQRSGSGNLPVIIACAVAAVAVIAALVVFFVVDPLGFQSSNDASDTKTTKIASSSSQDAKAEASSSSAASSSKSSSSSSSASTAASDDFIIAESSSRYLTEADLQALTDWELYIARNEIMARNGRGFKNQDLVDYFNGKDWYTKRYEPGEFDSNYDNILNEFEKKNANLIKDVEQRRGSPYLK